MNGFRSSLVVVLIVVFGAFAPPQVRAESERYCYDFLTEAVAQIKRSDAAGCRTDTAQPRPEYWGMRDPKELFTFCVAGDAKDLRYWLDQRESQLTYCEARGSSTSGAQRPENVGISGRPGNYTIHWTLRAGECPLDHYTESCRLQIRLETPPGRPGGYALELTTYKSGFTSVRADHYPGQPGEVVRLKWHGCQVSPAWNPWPDRLRSNCDRWSELALVMPAAPPEFHPARIVALDPSEYVPDRLKRDQKLARRSNNRGFGPTNPSFYSFYVRLEGTSAGFEPVPFQAAEAWEPFVRLRLLAGRDVVHEGSVQKVPGNGVFRFDVPSKVLNSIPCTHEVSGVCATLDVEAESIREFKGVLGASRREAITTNRVQLKVVTGDRDALQAHQASGEVRQSAPSTLGGRRGPLQAPATLNPRTPQRQATPIVTAPAWEQPVPAVEDSEKYEGALGSADTATRMRKPSVPSSEQARAQNAPAGQQPDRTQSMVRSPASSQPTLPPQQMITTQTLPPSEPPAGQRATILKPPAATMVAPRAGTMVQAAPSQLASISKLEAGINRIGADYRSHVPVATAQACQALCMDEGQCKAWTWVTAEKRCWLKNSVPQASRGDCCTSGVK